MAQQSTNPCPHVQPLLVTTPMHICIWPTKFSSPLYNLCPLQEADTCLHVLSTCTNLTLNNIQTTKRNKVLWQIHKLLLSHSTTRDTILMDTCTHLRAPLENTIPTWLYPCICITRPCQCLAKVKPNIIIIATTSPKKTTHYRPNSSLH